MPLGAQDKEAAGGTDLLRLGVGDGLMLLQLLCKKSPGLQHILILGFAIAGGLADDLLGEAGLAQVGLGQKLRVAAQHNVGAAAGHIGGDGDGAQLAGLGHDLRFLLVILGVEDGMGDAPLFQQAGEVLALFDGNGAHQDGLALLMAGHDLVNNGPVLAGFVLIDHVRVIQTDDRLIGGDLDNIQAVDGLKLLRLGDGGAGHAGELVIETEVVLEGDGGQGFVLLLDIHMLLGLDGLVEALGIAAAQHQAAGELIHDDDFPVLDNIVNVPLHDAVGLQGLIDMVGEGGILDVRQVLQAEGPLGLGHAPGGEGGGAGLLVHHIVGVQILGLFLLLVHGGIDLLFQAADKIVGLAVEVGALIPLAGNDQGCPGLVDEDGVHLVHNGEGVAPLDHALFVQGHVIPQIVKAHLIVGAVGNVAIVGFPALLIAEPVDDEAHAEAQEAVHLAHPLTVTAGQVVVDGDDMHALAGQGVQVGGQDRHQGLAFAGLHLGDAALVQDDAADQLHPEGLHAQHTPGRLPGGGKGLGQDVIQSFPLGEPLLELSGFGLQFFIAEGGVFPAQRFYFIRNGSYPFQFPIRIGAENLCKYAHDNAPFQKFYGPKISP